MESKLMFVGIALMVVLGVTIATPEEFQAEESVHGHGHGHGNPGWGWGHGHSGHNHGHGHGHGHGNGWGSDYYAEPKYAYTYGVSDHYTGDAKQATEQRNKGWTKGSYSVVQPDGIIRTVKYQADPWNGFQAVVHNKGWAQHPVTYSHQPTKYNGHQPAHSAPIKDQH